MWRLALSLVFVGIAAHLGAQIDHAGSGRALRFNGSGGYIDLGNIYDDLNLPLTISAWVKIDASAIEACPIFASQENMDLYNGIQIFVQPTAVIFEYGDGNGNNSPAYRKGKIAFLNSVVSDRWVHICGVMNSSSDIQIYINGIDVGGDYSGSSALPMASNFPTDVAKIGTYMSNGHVYKFNGEIDEVRVWNRGLSATEVRDGMCKRLQGNEPGLIGYWNFDETSGSAVYDKSSNGFDGQLVGPSTRVYSGAPVGDASINSYQSNWFNQSLTLSEGVQTLTVDSIQGTVAGIHNYVVRNPPSQNIGVDPSVTANPYFGTYLASLDSSGTKFRAKMTDHGQPRCEMVTRRDNSVAQWAKSKNPEQYFQRVELIGLGSDNQNLIPQLGSDSILCDHGSYQLDSKLNPTEGPIKWSTGETTPVITVTQSGLYWVESENCAIHRDSIAVGFLQSPKNVSLGPDRTICRQPVLLVATPDSTMVNFLWQDGSKMPTYLATNAGTYWVKVFNSCGLKYDTVSIIKMAEQHDSHPDLGPDRLVCDASSVVLNSNTATDVSYRKWNTGASSQSISVTQSGTYWVESGTCEIIRDSIVLAILNSPRNVGLGDDVELCAFSPRKLVATPDSTSVKFLWQDGSTKPTFIAGDFGTYWVKVFNACGASADTVVMAKPPSIDPSQIADVFTPNGDDNNESYVVDESYRGQIAFSVYNRWGKQVYYSPSYKNDWDGGDLSAGVYFILLHIGCQDIKMPLTLIR